MRSLFGKPFVSADSCFFQNDKLKFHTDLLTMMWIWYHYKNSISHHVMMLLARIWSCEPKSHQSLDEFAPGDGEELSRQLQLAPLRTLWYDPQ